MAPPSENRNARRQPGVGGSGSAELNSKQSDNETPSAAQDIIDATERAEDLLTLWQEHRRLRHRIQYSCLRFEHVGVDTDLDDLTSEILTWRRTVEALARTWGRTE